MPMDLASLRALVRAEKSDALSADDATTLSQDRERAMKYYLGDVSDDLPTPTDRSKAVSFDVSDTVEGMMPTLMEIFASGDEVVMFEPVGPEDEDAAAQETDYVNHVFMQRNPGFLVLYSFIKDALLSKVGTVKVWWEETEKESEETYQAIPDDALAIVKASPDVEITEDNEYPDPMTGGMLHDIKVVQSKTYGCAKVEGVPPEEFGISKRAKSIGDANYCFHFRPNRTASDLIADGFDEDQVKALATSAPSESLEALARDTVNEGTQFGSDGTRGAERPVATTEHYIKVDYEETGKPRIYRVVTAGDTDEVLKRAGKPAIDAQDFMPFAAMTPYIVTHRFYGRSVADMVMDIQRIKTSLLRGALDNVYLANNQRLEISETHAGKNTIDDLLTNRPGGLVRTKMPGGLLPIPNQSLGPFVYPMIEYMDATREWRTGVTKQGQGLDPNALQNIGENAILDAANSARAKSKLIARIFAETGIRDLFSLLHATIRKNDREENTVRLRNKWVKIDPRDWKTRNDMTVNVGLGPGSRDSQRGAVMQILAAQKEAMMAPQMGLVQPKHIYNALKKLVEYSGMKSVDLYFNDPTQNPPPPQQPTPDPKMIEVQAKMALEDKQAESDMAVQQVKTQGGLAVAQQKAELMNKTAMLDAALKVHDHQNKMAQAAVSHAIRVGQQLEQHSNAPLNGQPGG